MSRSSKTDAAGRTVTEVEVNETGAPSAIRRTSSSLPAARSHRRCCCCGPQTGKHPEGLANGSGQVGRNYMRHNQSILMALMREPNDTVFQKTLAVSDYYFGSDDWEYPLGLIQMCAASHGAQVRGETLPGWLEWLPKMPFEEMARHSMDFWLSSEDLPVRKTASITTASACSRYHGR